MKIIVQPPPSSPTPTDNPMTDAPATTATDNAARFAAVQAQFIETLDRIDKQLKRQIYALEEAGIITLRSSSSDQTSGVGGTDSNLPSEVPTTQSFSSVATTSHQDLGAIGARSKGYVASLDPDGMGRYGNLDTGVLNIASNTVERDMESELWNRAKEHVVEVVMQRAVSRVTAEGGGADIKMEG